MIVFVIGLPPIQMPRVPSDEYDLDELPSEPVTV
jgi:hypothetical protein